MKNAVGSQDSSTLSSQSYPKEKMKIAEMCECGYGSCSLTGASKRLQAQGCLCRIISKGRKLTGFNSTEHKKLSGIDRDCSYELKY